MKNEFYDESMNKVSKISSNEMAQLPPTLPLERYKLIKQKCD